MPMIFERFGESLRCADHKPELLQLLLQRDQDRWSQAVKCGFRGVPAIEKR
jgi:hypothetical protein